MIASVALEYVKFEVRESVPGSDDFEPPETGRQSQALRLLNLHPLPVDRIHRTDQAARVDYAFTLRFAARKERFIFFRSSSEKCSFTSFQILRSSSSM